MALPLGAPAPDPPAALPAWRKVLYGFGDLVIGIRITAFQFYLLPLYTDVVLLAPALAGLGKMLGLVWDGVNDPLTGYLSDRTSTRLGRRRPFLLGAALPLGLAFGFLWSPPAGLGSVSGFLYLLVAYVLFDTAFTFYATPYLALGAELSRDYHERTQLSAWRSFFHMIGLFAGGVVPGVVLRRYADAPAAGFVVVGFGVGAFLAVVALVTGACMREPPSPSIRPPLSWRNFGGGMRQTLRNEPFRVMLVTFAAILLASGLNSTLVPYAFRYWLEMPELVSGVIAVYLAASVIGIPFWTRLSHRVGKDRALRGCMLWAVVALAALPLALAPGMGMPRLAFFLVLAGLGNGGWAVLPAAITADIVDHDELDSRERREGAFFGVWTLVMKLAAAMAAGIVGLALQVLGYVPNAVQTPATILGIKLLYGPVPALVMLAAYLVFRRFPLTRERHQAVQATLAARRGA